MAELNLDESRRQLIEQIALFNEQHGMQPSAARVLGLFLVSTRDLLSFDEIRSELNFSKSAVSQSLSLLVSLRQVEPITLPGDRRRYFRLRLDGWRFHIEQAVEGALDYSVVLKKVLVLRQQEDSPMTRSLTELIDLLELLHQTLRDTVKKWQESH